MGSVRMKRNGEAISQWVDRIARRNFQNVQFELIDLRNWKLPFSDEPLIPAQGKYYSEYTKRWSQKVDDSSGFVIVSPEYNGGYPASLKNAIDHLAKEWNDKPVSIITYGSRGGLKVNAHLQDVTRILKMKPVQKTPKICLTKEMILDGIVNADESLKKDVPVVKASLGELVDSVLTKLK